jgi:hypothetical protein
METEGLEERPKEGMSGPEVKRFNDTVLRISPDES